MSRGGQAGIQNGLGGDNNNKRRKEALQSLLEGIFNKKGRTNMILPWFYVQNCFDMFLHLVFTIMQCENKDSE